MSTKRVRATRKDPVLVINPDRLPIGTKLFFHGNWSELLIQKKSATIFTGLTWGGSYRLKGPIILGQKFQYQSKGMGNEWGDWCSFIPTSCEMEVPCKGK